MSNNHTEVRPRTTVPSLQFHRQKLDFPSKMHAALQIEEVFIRITDALDQSTTDSRSTLYALARTCRTFHEPAINILWHTQTSLGPILSCIPSVKIYTSVPDRMVPLSRRKLVGSFRFYENISSILHQISDFTYS